MSRIVVELACWLGMAFASYFIGYDVGRADAREAAGLCTRDSGWMGSQPQLERC